MGRTVKSLTFGIATLPALVAGCVVQELAGRYRTVPVTRLVRAATSVEAVISVVAVVVPAAASATPIIVPAIHVDLQKQEH